MLFCELNSKTSDPISREYNYADFNVSSGEATTIQFAFESAQNYYPVCVYDVKSGASLVITNSWSVSKEIHVQIKNNESRSVSGTISIILVKKNLY